MFLPFFSETFFKNVDFSNSSNVNIFINEELNAKGEAVSEVVDLLDRYLQDNLPPDFSMNKFVKVRIIALCIEC